MRDRVGIKWQAKDIMRQARVSPYLITLAVMAVCFVLNKLVELVAYGDLFYTVRFQREYLDLFFQGDFNAIEALLDAVPENTTGVFFFSTLVSLFTVVLNGGYFIYCMGVRQGRRMPWSSLADGLQVAGKLIWCWIQISVRTFLWSLLFVIPGFVATYRYRFAYYNLLTDATLSAGEAIRLSCQQTRGIKGELFLLDLSFLGWYILASFTMGLLNVWLTPYVTLCDLAYFEDAQLRLGRPPYGTPPSPGGADLWL